MKLYVVLSQTSTQWCCYWIILQYRLIYGHSSCDFFGSQSCPPTRCEGNITGVGSERPPNRDSFQLWWTQLTFSSWQSKKPWRSTWGWYRGSLDAWQRSRKNNEEEKWDGLAVFSWDCQATVNAEESCNSVYILSPQAGVGKPRMGGAYR